MGARAFIILLLLSFVSNEETFAVTGKAARIVQGEVLEEMAKAKLDKKLMDLSQSNEMRVKQHPETNPSPNLLDPDSGNPTKSRMAFHDRVVPTCLQITNARQCEKWLAPYVSIHGVEGGSESSDLEELMGKAASQYSGNNPRDALGVFDIEKQGGQVIDRFGRLNLQGATKFQLKKEIRTAVDAMGYQNAQVELTRLPNEGGQGGNASEVAMPNEVYRAMARDWTQMLRNRLVAKLGQQRAASKEGGEFVTDADMPDCEQYKTMVENNQDPALGRERKLREQARLNPQTNRYSIDQRYEMCVAMKTASVYDVNPKIKDGEKTAGEGNESIDQALTRINIAMIDNAGLNPNDVPKPANIAFKREDYASLIADCEANGRNCGGIQQTNAEQIQGFNNARKEAWASIQNAAKRSSNINPDGYKRLTEEIATGQGAQSLIQLNGLTAEMKGELKGKEFVQKAGLMGSGPDNVLERTPSALTVKSTN